MKKKASKRVLTLKTSSLHLFYFVFLLNSFVAPVKTMLRNKLSYLFSNIIKICYRQSKLISILLSISTIFFYIFEEDFFSINPNIQETALMVSPGIKLNYQQTDNSIYNSDSNFYIIRSSGTSTLSIILSGDYFFDFFKDKSPKYFAHDIVVCNGKCDYSQFYGLIPQTIAEISFEEIQTTNSTLYFSSETPLDLIIACQKAFNINFKKEKRIRSKGHPYIQLAISKKYFSNIDSLLDALNRMENIFIHGQMIFYRKNGLTIPVTPLFITCFLITVPIVLGTFTNISYVLVFISFSLLFFNNNIISYCFILVSSLLFSSKWQSSSIGIAFQILCLTPCSPDIAQEDAFHIAFVYFISSIISMLNINCCNVF